MFFGHLKDSEIFIRPKKLPGISKTYQFRLGPTEGSMDKNFTPRHQTNRLTMKW